MHCGALAGWRRRVTGPVCHHCGSRSLHLAYFPREGFDAEAEQGWRCTICRCAWTLTWELREKGDACVVHGVAAPR